MSSESQKRAMEKFKETHDWAEYCSAARKRRIERLNEEGVLNPYGVVANGDTPKYNYIAKIKTEGRILIPFKIRKKFNIKQGDKFKVCVEEDKITLEKIYE